MQVWSAFVCIDDSLAEEIDMTLRVSLLRPMNLCGPSVVVKVGLSVLLLLGGLASCGQGATPTIDGRFQGAAEGYTTGYAVTLRSVGQTTLIAGSEIWVHEAANGDVSVALILPLSLKDNAYGANSATGYFSNSGKQSFKTLTGSDSAAFVLKNSSAADVTSFTLDFLEGQGIGGSVNGPNFLSGFTGGDLSLSVPANNVVGGASSMGFNFDTFGVSHPELFGDGASSPDPANSAFAAWVFEHTYEFQVKADAFGAGGFQNISQIMIAEVHLSPKKVVGNNKFVVDGDFIPLSSDPGPVNINNPEPGSVTLALTGIVGLLVARWRQRKKKHVEPAA